MIRSRVTLIRDFGVKGFTVVDELDVEVPEEDDVLRLEIQVHNFVEMQEPEGLGNLAHDVYYFLQGKDVPPFLNQVPDIVPRLPIATRQLAQQGIAELLDILIMGRGECLGVELPYLVEPRNKTTRQPLQPMNYLDLMFLLA